MTRGFWPLLFLCALFCGPAGSEEQSARRWGSSGVPPQDSLTQATLGGAETMKAAPPDTSRRNLKRADTVLVVKHTHQHREQIVAGGVIMACLVGIMVVMNNYNPR